MPDEKVLNNIRILNEALQMKNDGNFDSNKFRFVNYQRQTVVYPAMGNMNEINVVKTLLNVGDRSSGKTYTASNKWSDLPIDFAGTLLLAMLRGYIQSEESFKGRQMGLTINPHCNVTLSTHGDILNNHNKMYIDKWLNDHK